jgi:anti-sigma B factor antagonist
MESFSGGEFGVDFVHSDGEALVLLSGELDVATAPALREHLAELASQGLINISVDLSALRFIDSVGLSVFVVAQKHLEHMGGSFLLLRPSPRIQKLLQVTALAPLLLAKPVVVPSIADEAGLRISLVLRRDVDACDETTAAS